MTQQQIVPHVGVGVVVLEGQQVLLIRRGKEPRMGEWSLPGGHLQRGETLRAAAAREVLEETGLSVFVRDLIDAVDLIDVAGNGRITSQYVLIDFWADVVGGDISAGDDASDAAWHDIDSISSLGMWDKTVEIISRACVLRDAAVADGRLP